MRRDRSVEASSRHLRRRIVSIVLIKRVFEIGLDRRRSGFTQNACKAERLLHVIDRAPNREFQDRGLGLRNPRLGRRCGLAVDFKVVSRRSHLNARNAIDRGVMDFRQDSETTRRQPFDLVEAFDHVHLPKWLA